MPKELTRRVSKRSPIGGNTALNHLKLALKALIKGVGRSAGEVGAVPPAGFAFAS
jgi:hypothetical protein